MDFFLHTFDRIRIIKDAQEFDCTPAEFLALEPDYAGQPDVYWTPEFHSPADAPDCSGYIAKVGEYIQSFPIIYAHVSLSKETLNVDLANDVITFTADLKASLNPEADNLPVNQSWILRISHENEMNVDAFFAEFVNGACQKAYTYRPGTPLGKWFVDENIFDKVTVGDVTYQIRLAAPVNFTIYRELV